MDDDLQDVESPMRGDGFEQVLSDDDGLVDPRVHSQDSAGQLDSENLSACNRVEIVRFRHVSFAETVEMLEFDLAVHAAPAPMVEYDAAPTMAYRVYAAPVLVVEYEAPAQTVAH